MSGKQGQKIWILGGGTQKCKKGRGIREEKMGGGGGGLNPGGPDPPPPPPHKHTHTYTHTEMGTRLKGTNEVVILTFYQRTRSCTLKWYRIGSINESKTIIMVRSVTEVTTVIFVMLPHVHGAVMKIIINSAHMPLCNNIKTVFSQVGDSHVKDKTVLRQSYLLHEEPYTGKTASLYWDGPLVAICLCCWHRADNNPFLTRGIIFPENPSQGEPRWISSESCSALGSLTGFIGFFFTWIDHQCTLMVSHKQEHGEITIETLTSHEWHHGHGNAFHVTSPLQE